jgi:hypothetical protein
MPPIQCVRLLQYNMLFGAASISCSIVAPVVVNPDMVSKKALVNEDIVPLNKNGIVPNKEMTIQARATIR